MLRPSFVLNFVFFADSGIWWIKPDILTKSDINNFLCSKTFILLEVNLPGKFIMFDELEEWVYFKWKSFLGFGQ